MEPKERACSNAIGEALKKSCLISKLLDTKLVRRKMLVSSEKTSIIYRVTTVMLVLRSCESHFPAM